MCSGETRAPQRDQRRDQPGPWCQRRRQQAVQPRQQHEARAPADVRDTGIPKPHADHPHEGQGRQDGAKADERRHDAGHDRGLRLTGAAITAAVLGPPGDRAQHPSEDHGVHRKEHIPVEQPEQSGRLEHGGLVDEGAASVRHDLELEPRAARQLHFRREPQSSARFVRLDSPEVERVADGRRVRVAPSATHPDAAHQQVDRAPDSPQPRGEVPAALAPDLRDGHERAVRVDRHVDLASVDQLATEARVGRRRCRSSRGARIRPPRQRERAILVANGATDRFAQADRPDREYRERRGIGDDGPVLQSRNQFAPDPCVDGRHESQPQARQARRQQRHRDHHALQPTLPRVLAHHVAVARLIGPADFERAALAVGQVKRSGKIGEHVIDADRLRQRRDPPRANHDRQSLDERADQLERQAPGPDDDRRAKFHDRDAAFSQRLAGLDPALEMLAERLVARREATEVDDPANPSPPRRFAKIAGGDAIRFTVVAVCAHGVHQVIGHVDARERAIERRRVEKISGDDLRRRRHARGERGRVPRQTAKPDSRGFEDGHQPSPDVAGRAGHENGRSFLRARFVCHHGSLRRCARSRSVTWWSSASDVRVRAAHRPAAGRTRRDAATARLHPCQGRSGRHRLRALQSRRVASSSRPCRHRP